MWQKPDIKDTACCYKLHFRSGVIKKNCSLLIKLWYRALVLLVILWVFMTEEVIMKFFCYLWKKCIFLLIVVATEVSYLSSQRGHEEEQSHSVWRRDCLGCRGFLRSWKKKENTSQTSAVYMSGHCVFQYICMITHSLALVPTSSRRERRMQKDWLIMVSTSEKGLRKSRSSLMV